MYSDVSSAVEHAVRMIEDGADVIDIGGMSTRPGFEDIPESVELSRIIPVIAAIRKEMPDAVLSVDTFRAGVAEAALSLGVQIINDVTGLQGDERMAEIVSASGCRVVLMRNPSGDYDKILSAAKATGIRSENIILDPGVGFTDTRDEDISLIRSIPYIREKYGYPVLLGVSRKRITSMCYTEDTRPSQRDGASIAIALKGIELGADIVRVHDVKQTAAAIKAWEILR